MTRNPIRPKANVSWIAVVLFHVDLDLGIVDPHERRIYFGTGQWVEYEDANELVLMVMPYDRISSN